MNAYQALVTFEDTNIVGNAYFTSFLRWHHRARDNWLRSHALPIYKDLLAGSQRVVTKQLSMRFFDPTGASIGDLIKVAIDVQLESGKSLVARSEAQRSGALLAAAQQECEFVDRCSRQQLPPRSELLPPSGRAFSIRCPAFLEMLDTCGALSDLFLLRLQGKCRELFLLHHAPSSLELIARHSLAFHTSQVACWLIHDVSLAADDQILTEMRLTKLKGGRLSMRFDYFQAHSKVRGKSLQWFASGLQEISCKRRSAAGMVPCVFPADLLTALAGFTESVTLRSNICDALDFLDHTEPPRDQVIATQLETHL